MNKEDYRKLIERMIREIHNEEDLKRIFNYIHRIFMRADK